ncbi:MAG TPA: 2-oxoacid:acceptor oxidoreductase family protein, partial [Proteiniclasticum sp.]|nr:2-oxoacid:acceptor oxidoreductase family protein [Proteiniclasticum sp.]
IILDSNLVTRDVTREDVTVLRIPAQDEAGEIGSVKIANMVLLGALVGMTEVISEEALLGALKGHGKEAFFEMNKAAIVKGIEYAKKVAVTA